MKSIKTLSLIFILMIAPISLLAQGGSNYSIFGIGDIFSGANASYQAMGGTIAAVPNEHSISVKNPALWGKVSTTRLMTGYSFNQHYNSSDNNEIYQNNGQISGVYALYSIDTAMGLAASFGIHSYSNKSYLISNPFSISKDGLSQTGRHTFQGGGGLSSAYLGASTEIIDNLIVGASAFALFGPLSSVALTEFDDSYSYNYSVSHSDYASGWGTRLGLYYTYSDFGIGAYYENVGSVKFDRETVYSSSLLPDTTIKSNFNETLPTNFGFGLSYKTGKFLLAADVGFTQVGDFDYNSGTDAEFQDAMRFSFGLNRIGNPSRGANYLDRISYKAGFSYQNLYYKIKNNSINEISFSLGAELPVGAAGVIDAALIFGTRGLDTQGLIKEYFGKLYVEISVGEIWFKPFKKRY